MTQRMRSSRRHLRRRSGSVILEWLLVLLVVLIVFFAAFQLGTLQYVQLTIVHSATAGARVAGKDTAAIEDVVNAVNLILTATNYQITDVADSGGKVIFEEVVFDENTNTFVTLETDFGDPNLDCDAPTTPTLSPNEARVTVCIEVSETPVIDVSDCYGLGVTDKRFHVSSFVKKELPQPSPP
jgi:Flp pilus assembly protein TadG